MQQVVCRSDELGAGEIKQTQVGRKHVAIVRTSSGDLHALASRCLHQGAPLALGSLHAKVLPAGDTGHYLTDPHRHVLKCPWHGYEYDVETGCAVFDSARRLQKFVVFEKDNEIVVGSTAPKVLAIDA